MPCPKSAWSMVPERQLLVRAAASLKGLAGWSGVSKTSCQKLTSVADWFKASTLGMKLGSAFSAWVPRWIAQAAADSTALMCSGLAGAEVAGMVGGGTAFADTQFP